VSINKSSGENIKDAKLLARVVSFYQHTLTLDNRGITYLKNDLGITDNQSIKDFGAGYVNGTLLEILPQDEEVKKSLQKLGILNGKGHEVFYNCIVFPLFDANGAIVNLYGRNIDAQNKALYLTEPPSGIVNRQTLKRSQTIILTGSIIDALLLYDQGFKNVISLYNMNCLSEEHLSFFNRRVNQAYIVFHADDQGRKGAEFATNQLREKNIAAHIVELPSKDVHLYFKRHTPEEFENLLKKANPDSLEQSEKVKKRVQTFYKDTEYGFVVGYGERFYEIKAIQRNDTQLKITIKASRDLQSNAPFELTTIDLYSSRSRSWLAKACVEIFNASEELIKEDITKIIDLVEGWKPKQRKSTAAEISKEDQAIALRFLKNPDIFKEILSDFETLGITGEETNKLAGYLAAVSRKLDEPLSVLIQSRSAAGKSTLQDAILALVPDEDYVKYTRITDQALFYKEEDALVHKIIAIEEDQGMGGAAYSIRNIQSSKKIMVAATGKDSATGKMKTEEYTVKGPVAVMITTTAAELEGEMASRFLFLTIDESVKMTEAIHLKQREADTLDGLMSRKKTDTIIKKHHTAQRLSQALPVVNPFTPYLSYPSGSIKTRRDHKKYLGLIRSIAFLFQYQRQIRKLTLDHQEIEYIEATLDDIEKANHLANEVLGQSLDDLAPPSRTLLDQIYSMVKQESEKQNLPLDQYFFNRRMIREYTGWTDWQIREHIKQLEELEYLNIKNGARGKEYSYALQYKGQPDQEGKRYLNLTTVEEIKIQMKKDSK